MLEEEKRRRTISIKPDETVDSNGLASEDGGYLTFSELKDKLSQEFNNHEILDITKTLETNEFSIQINLSEASNRNTHDVTIKIREIINELTSCREKRDSWSNTRRNFYRIYLVLKTEFSDFMNGLDKFKSE